MKKIKTKMTKGMVLIVMLIIGMNVQAQGFDRTANLALDKTAVARDRWDGDGGIYQAANAVDGNTATSWMAAPDGPGIGSWIYVDLSEQYVLNKVKIHWVGNRWPNGAWKLQVTTVAPDANGDADWVDVYIGNRATDPITCLFSGLTAGRYVRFIGEAQATSYGYHISEFEVYGIGEYDETKSDDLTDVFIDPSPASTYLRDELPLSAIALKETNLPFEGATYEWSITSANAITATITSDGVFSATATGEYTVTCEASASGTTVSSTATITVNDLPTFNPSNNLALNKLAKSRDYYIPDGAIADRAVDGNTGTFWMATPDGPGMGSWIYVDLGRKYVLTAIDIHWHFNRWPNGAWKLQVATVAPDANGDTDWTDVYTGSQATNNFSTDTKFSFPFDATPGRYVRFIGTAQSMSWGYAMKELEVYGSGYYDPAASADLASVTILNDYTAFYADDNYTFRSNAINGQGQPVEDATIEWSVTDENDDPTETATITSGGVFNAIQTGTYKIICTAKKDEITVLGSSTITVNAARIPSEITFLRNIDDLINENNGKLHYSSDIYLLNEAAVFRVIVKDQYNNAMNDATIEYTVTTGNENNVTINETEKTVSFSVTGDYALIAQATKKGESVSSTSLSFKVVSFPEIAKSEMSIAEVSSTEGASVGENILDGNRLTGNPWSSAHAPGGTDNRNTPAWIIVDLGATHQLSMVEVSWERAAAKVYTIEGCATLDGTYEQLGGETFTSGEWNYHVYRQPIAPSASAIRYLKIYCTQAYTNYGNQIFEIAVWEAVPATAEWNGTSTEWNNRNSWNGGIIPGTTTKVTLPSPTNSTFKYPILESTDNAVCDNIHFETGAELGNPQYLKYFTAEVDMDLTDTGLTRESRYYTIGAPLKNMVVGDFSFGGFPTVYARYATAITSSLGDGSVIETVGFTDDLPDYDVSLDLGFGFAYKLKTGGFDETLTFPYFMNQPSSSVGQNDNHTINRQHHFDSGSTESDSGTSNFYYFYSDATHERADMPPVSVERPKTSFTIDGVTKWIYEGNRFIAEGNNNTIPAAIQLPLNDGILGTLIANPLMSHLDFAALLNDPANEEAGNPIIEPYFRIWNGSNIYVNYDGATTDATDVDGNPIFGSEEEGGQLIAPIQSFFVTKKVGVSAASLTLTPNNISTVKTGGAILRSTTINNQKEVLKVTASSATGASAILLNRGENLEEYRIPKVFTFYPEVPELYIVDEGAIEIKDMNQTVNTVPLGLRALDGAEITLTFAGLNTFAEKVSLFDTQTNQTIALNESVNTYSFTNDANDMNSRFLLVFAPQSPTVMNELEKDNLLVISKDNTIRVVSSPLNRIQSVKIYNVQGQLLKENAHLSMVAFEVNVKAKGIYLVDVVTEKARIVKKIVNN